MTFASVYPLYITKVERKDRTKQEVDEIILRLTGYDQAWLEQQLSQKSTFEQFFAQAPESILKYHKSKEWYADIVSKTSKIHSWKRFVIWINSLMNLQKEDLWINS